MGRDPREFVVGDRVPGTKWVVRGKLGEGGMGLVLDVVKEPGIRGAMKVMLPGFAKRPEFVARFFDEVRLLAQLRHPNIVQVFDFDQLDDGTPYVVMERLLGVTLRAGLCNLREKGTPISAKLIYEITRQLCEGLFRAHSSKPTIVHRDVKPENIFFHQPEFADTVVKVIDFGIAAVLDGTRDRRVFGTPRHMAPEQIRGDVVSPATDVYAVALVLYELLTGRFPWDVDLRNEQALVDAHLHQSPAPASKYTLWVPRRVDQWVMRALSKDAKDRPQDAYEFISKLYELQFVNDGTSDSVVDINTTAPTLACLAEAVEDAVGTQTKRADSVDTSRGMTAPPMEGASLELASSELGAGVTEPVQAAPMFSSQTMDRAALATTRLPSGVGRLAATRTAIPTTRPVPKNDTLDLSPARFGTATTPEEDRPPPLLAVERLPTAAETPMASASTPRTPLGAQRSLRAALYHRSRLLPAAIGAALIPGLFVGLFSFGRSKWAEPPAQAARDTHPGTPSSNTAPSSRGLQTEATLPAPSDPAPMQSPMSSSLAAHAVGNPLLAASIQAHDVSARRVPHPAAKPTAIADEPDDGRDLLYTHP